jgi:hypothetical protein
VSDWTAEAQRALVDFQQVARLGGVELGADDLVVEHLPAPHRAPTRLPSGKMAVYAFWGDGGWLKVGKVGPNSNARYTSQHYLAGSAPSTLAASLLASPPSDNAFDPTQVGAWMRERTCRLNILMPASRPKELLSLLEAFLHLRLRPRFEG